MNGHDRLVNEMTKHSLKGFHLARLFDYEITEIQKDGLIPQELSHLNARLNRAVKMGKIEQEFAQQLIQKNDLLLEVEMNVPIASRKSGQLWFTMAPPYKVSESGLEIFLKPLGG